MLYAFLTFIYGIGFGLTFIGEACLLALIDRKTSLPLFCAKVIAWPLTWAAFGYKIWESERHL